MPISDRSFVDQVKCIVLLSAYFLHLQLSKGGPVPQNSFLGLRKVTCCIFSSFKLSPWKLGSREAKPSSGIFLRCLFHSSPIQGWPKLLPLLSLSFCLTSSFLQMHCDFHASHNQTWKISLLFLIWLPTFVRRLMLLPAAAWQQINLLGTRWTKSFSAQAQFCSLSTGVLHLLHSCHKAAPRAAYEAVQMPAAFLLVSLRSEQAFLHTLWFQQSAQCKNSNTKTLGLHWFQMLGFSERKHYICEYTFTADSFHFIADSLTNIIHQYWTD